MLEKGDKVKFEGKLYIIVDKYSDKYRLDPQFWYEIKSSYKGLPKQTNFSHVVRGHHLTKIGV